MARRQRPAPSPRARAPRAARAAPREPRGGRTPAPASLLRNQPIPARVVTHFPPRRVDLRPQPVRLGEVAILPCLLSPAGEGIELGRSLFFPRQRLQPEDVERAPHELVVTPLVHERERVGSVEVVVE